MKNLASQLKVTKKIVLNFNDTMRPNQFGTISGLF
jgi:hypothetical protein